MLRDIMDGVLENLRYIMAGVMAMVLLSVAILLPILDLHLAVRVAGVVALSGLFVAWMMLSIYDMIQRETIGLRHGEGFPGYKGLIAAR